MNEALVTGLLGVVAVVAAAAAAKYFKADATPTDRIGRLETRVETVETDLRIVTDYAHELRGCVVTLGGTPPPWPEGLKQ